MDRERVISKLREHERELRAAGIMALSLFGSVARGDANEQSDVDLMADFDGAKGCPCWAPWVLKTGFPTFSG